MMKFYKCSVCGNIVSHLYDSGVRVVCCGREMKELIPNTTDAATEKHVPVVEVKGTEVTVKIGTVAHPMEAAHYIEWIALETDAGNQRKVLKPGEKPEATFHISANDKILATYAYCNLHGLWKA